MKQILLFLIMVSLSAFTVGCRANNQSSLLSSEDESNIEEKEVEYIIDQIVLSKSFQSIEPNVEVYKKNKKTKLLVSLGLVESSGTTIDKIIKRGNDIDIYVNCSFEKDKIQLAVPQIRVEVQEPLLKKTKDLNFNIININYKPIDIKLGINEVINKVISNLNVFPSSIPEVNLTRVEDAILWDISFYNIFDKENLNPLLVNLSVQVDANSGDIINSKKNFISNYIDDGSILGFAPKNYLLYRKIEESISDKKAQETLWYYNTNTNKKDMIYLSKYKILSAAFSPNLEYISLIEANEDISNLYIVSKSDKKAYKVSAQSLVNPNVMKWKNKNTLYLIDNTKDGSKVFSYTVNSNKILERCVLDKKIESLEIHGDNFLITEGEKENLNKKIYLTNDWKKFNLSLSGFNAKFLNKDKIVYLKNNDKDDKNILYIYDIKEKKVVDELNHNVSSYSVLPDNTIAFVEKNASYNDFTLYKYSYNDKTTSGMAKINGESTYYDKDKSLIYLDLISPLKNKKNEVIYSIDLTKIEKTH